MAMGPEPPPGYGQGDDQDENAKLLAQYDASMRSYFTDEVVPQINRHADEQIDAKFAELRSWVTTNVPSLDLVQLSHSVAAEIAPQLSADIQAVVDAISARIDGIEARVAGARQTVEGQPAAGASATQAQDNSSAAPTQGDYLVNQADKVLDVFEKRGLSIMERMATMKRGSMYDVAWAANLRTTDPITATILSQQLNPDPLNTQLPTMLAQAVLTGMKARVSANQTQQGGGPWTPSPAPSPAPYATPAASSPARGTVSMNATDDPTPRPAGSTAASASVGFADVLGS